ncbi:hypothetical protein ABIE87_006461 [Bradyrhizobium diazoefficiens]|jgi:hypothetical protein
MTAAMFVLGMAVRTPTVLWITAMGCDTIIAVTYMVLHHHF